MPKTHPDILLLHLPSNIMNYTSIQNRPSKIQFQFYRFQSIWCLKGRFLMKRSSYQSSLVNLLKYLTFFTQISTFEACYNGTRHMPIYELLILRVMKFLLCSKRSCWAKHAVPIPLWSQTFLVVQVKCRSVAGHPTKLSINLDTQKCPRLGL